MRLLRTIGLLGLLLVGVPTGRAFVLFGPANEPWQIPTLGFDLPGDLNGAPKNLNEEYRWNVPVIYYSYDQTFLEYFGAQGVQAVDQGFAVYNNLLPASRYDVGLTNIPLSVRRVNYSAQAQTLLDVKSTTMSFLAEQMGLAEPERYAFCLHARHVGPGGCPADVSYLTVQRNLAYAPSSSTQVQYSDFINGAFLGYRIVDYCNTPPFPLSSAVPVFPDAYDFRLSPVASRVDEFGQFFNGLTRDDVAGIRYLISSNNINYEPSPPGVEVLVTNLPVIITTSDLSRLAADSATNAPAALQALYPNLLIASYTFDFTSLVTTNYTFYYTNYSWTTTGAAPVLVALTNYTTNLGNIYQYQFANVITNPGPPTYTVSNPPYTNSTITIVYTNIVAGPYVTPDQVVTNVYVTNVTVNGISGDYYLIPANACGGLVVASNLLSLQVATTNAPESVPAPQLLITNAVNFLTTSNLAQLLADAYTNGPVALQALYPNLQITRYIPSFTNLVTTNLFPYYTNYPWATTSTPPILAYQTNYSTNIGFVYQYQFGNVVTSTYSPRSMVGVLVTNVANPPWALPGFVVTNVYTSNYWADIPGGDYYLVPTSNGCGGIILLSNILSQVTVVTNGTQITTNNLPGSTFTNFYYSETITSYFTNHNFAYLLVTCYSNPFASSLTRITYFTNRNLRAAIVTCETNGPALRRGVEKITFIRRDFDSLIGQFFVPATNFFSSGAIINNTNALQNLRRTVDNPDILIQAQDLAAGPDFDPNEVEFPAVARNINFNESAVPAGQFGPGTLGPPVSLTFNSAGVAWVNFTPGVGQARGLREFIWASYDGSTNAPALYPNGTSITNLINQIVMQINTTSLPAGTVNVTYPPTQLSGQGGSPPLTWSLAPSSPGMPPGLVLFSDGTVGGIPRVEGIYDFLVRLTDSGGRYVEKAVTLTVNP